VNCVLLIRSLEPGYCCVTLALVVARRKAHGAGEWPPQKYLPCKQATEVNREKKKRNQVQKSNLQLCYYLVPEI